MRAIVVAGVLGSGTALVFALAALTATLFPHGSTVSAGWNGGAVLRGGWNGGLVPGPAPMVVPAIEPPMIEGGVVIPDPAFQALPGDVVRTSDGPSAPQP